MGRLKLLEMKANELRVSNWVIVKDAPAEVVLQVRAQHIAEAEEHNPSWFLYPIPLTPEVLGKCGFGHTESLGHEYVTMPNIVIRLSDMMYGTLDYEGKFDETTKVNYLHQLQNLYFALTGTELEYNPIKETV